MKNNFEILMFENKIGFGIGSTIISSASLQFFILRLAMYMEALTGMPLLSVNLLHFVLFLSWLVGLAPILAPSDVAFITPEIHHRRFLVLHYILAMLSIDSLYYRFGNANLNGTLSIIQLYKLFYFKTGS